MNARYAAFFAHALLSSWLLGCNTILGTEPGQLTNQVAATDASASDASVLDSFVAVDASVDETQAASQDDADAAPVEAGCGPGKKTCNALCVDVADPVFGCAETSCSPCSLAHALPLCGSDTCLINTCDPGYADCDGNAANGCETDLSTASHCGTCNSICPPTAPNCAPSGSASFYCTTNCTAMAPVLCGTQCVDLMTSATHCGGCNVVCATVANGSASCTAGVCGIQCDPSFHACGSVCASDASPVSCGSSCTPCPAPANSTATCSNDQCGFVCNGGFHTCGGACASNTAPATCGASCVPCPSGPNSTATCNGVACGLTCAPGFGDCDGNPANGCEVALATDPQNCGMCAKACAAGQTCQASTCVSTMDAGADGGPASDAAAEGASSGDATVEGG